MRRKTNPVNTHESLVHTVSEFQSFSAKDGYIVELKFLHFVMEESYGECYDYVSLFDGPSIEDNSTIIGTFCETNPGTIRSTGIYLTMQMVSDDDYGEAGFKAEYQHLDAGLVCGGNLFNSQG